MRAMTKSAVRLAREALTIGRAALPSFSSRFSRHDFTQPQLFALLLLRQFLRTDYRGVVAWLAEWGELRRGNGGETLTLRATKESSSSRPDTLCTVPRTVQFPCRARGNVYGLGGSQDL